MRAPTIGSSPRVRGTPSVAVSAIRHHRFIPARAGNTSSVHSDGRRQAVHPRACGEHAGGWQRVETVRRFIPARAGNTWASPSPGCRAPVHPRACGEHLCEVSVLPADSGSSPRVRGTLAVSPLPLRPRRFIPARAGNTPCTRRASASASVHPRACGEHLRDLGHDRDEAGSSPRVRGTRRAPGPGGGRLRFIPARAGNTLRPATAESARPVHPRACGEHWLRASPTEAANGSSPRVRGTLHASDEDDPHDRFIPARAGNTTPTRRPPRTFPVHPRACGEHSIPDHDPPAFRGSSPRVRGTHSEGLEEVAGARFIPARAGNTRRRGSSAAGRPVHPRACGEHAASAAFAPPSTGSSPRVRGTRTTRAPGRAVPTVHPRACGEHRCASNETLSIIGSSPRVRGTRSGDREGSPHLRFIPARAGNTARQENHRSRSSVHPRACGEHAGHEIAQSPPDGSSPRVRGTQTRQRRESAVLGFIPARAGNTAT